MAQQNEGGQNRALERAIWAKLENILSVLEYRGPRVRRYYMCRCPAHDDRTPSLSVRATEDGRIRFHCFAGCQTTEILRALGLTPRDLMPDGDAKPLVERRANATAKGAKAARQAKKSNLGEIVAEYEYQDESGRPICQVVRFEPKSFRQRFLTDEGRWVWNMRGVRPPLYRLPELLAAPADEWIFVVEGEKDVEVLRQINLVATCNIQGAGKWKAEYNQWLTKRCVCILPDNDEAGRKHAHAVVRHLRGVARHVLILELPNLPVKGDVSDWLAQGGDRVTLLALLCKVAGVGLLQLALPLQSVEGPASSEV